jgi:putative membrane protein insertion efficiency factor
LNLLQAILIFALRVYRWTISPAQIFLFGSSAGCRFTPTCSQNAIDAIRSRGAARGSALAAKRICRCHPWGDCGHDPIPKVEGGRRKAEIGISPKHSF